jgi:hypothetical protein
LTLRTLRAGPVTAELDGTDLRYVRVGDREVVRRMYAAVRDGSWNTIQPRLGPVEVNEDRHGFRVTFDARHTSQDIDFAWQGTIAGDSDGRITYSLEGEALEDTEYARIGICVHHPLRECAGRPYSARTPQGTIAGELPTLIAPQRYENGVYVPIFPSFDRLEIELDGGGQVRFEFEGDLWETEDHRNWTDSNFKTYSTPMALGYPHRLAKGSALAQRVVVSLSGVPEREAERQRIELKVGEPVAPFPAVGLGMMREGSLADAELALVRELGPAHLRVDVRLDDEDWPDELARAQSECLKVGCDLELALHLRPEQQAELAALAEALTARPPVARVLVVLAHGETATPEETTPAELVELARTALQSATRGAAFAGGTDLYFCELNRTPPEAAAMDGVFFPVMPQMHAFADLDLVENLESQADTVVSARALGTGKPVVVSPVTLKGRFPYVAASGREEATSAGEVPDSVDHRQASPLGAAWTAGSLKYLAEAGAESVTYYETVGPRGVISDGSPNPEFPATRGEPFPLFAVLAQVTRWHGLDVLECGSSAPLRAVGLAVDGGAATNILVTNLTPQRQEVAVRPPSGDARTLVLEPFETRRESWQRTESP